MRALIQSFAAVFNRGGRLTHIERKVIDVVGSHLASSALSIWEQQVQSIIRSSACQMASKSIFTCAREWAGGPLPCHDSGIETSL